MRKSSRSSLLLRMKLRRQKFHGKEDMERKVGETTRVKEVFGVSHMALGRGKLF